MDSAGAHVSHVSTLDDQNRSLPHPKLGPPFVIYEKYQTHDVMSPAQPWALSFVRSDDFGKLREDSNVHLVFDHEHEDEEYFLGKSFRKSGMLDEQEGIIEALENRYESIASSDVRERAESESALWELLAAIGSLIHPGWHPYGTYVAP